MKFTCYRQALSLTGFAAAWLVCLVFVPAVQGGTTTIATTGDQAPGTPAGAVFRFFGSPVLNDGGQTAYEGSLRSGSGGVDSTNDSGIWRDSTLLARAGSRAGGTPSGAVFIFFGSPVLNDVGQTVYQGFLRRDLGGVDFTNDSGIWRDSTLLARAGSRAGGTPSGAVFSSFGSPVLNDVGQTVYKGFLRRDLGSVDSTNDSGIWRDSTLLAREGSRAGGTPSGAVFIFFDNPVLNDAGQTAYKGFLRSGSGGVDFTNDSGIWRDSTLLAREGSRAGGTPSGAVFSSFGSPVLNDVGQTVYKGFLRRDLGGVDFTNDSGIWRDSTLLAREGSRAGGTPSGAVFSSFGSPVLNDGGQTAYEGSLRLGSGGVDSTNNSGIWRDSTLLAREGSRAGGTPNGAVFRSFGSPVLNDAGQTAYKGFLRSGSGGVDSTNNSGIWITGTNGQSLLVVQEGDTLTGRTVSSLSLSENSGGSDGRGRGLNNFSQVVYSANFTNGDQGVFLFTPEIHWTRSFSSSWDSSFNWTIEQLPGDPHDVFIDPIFDLTVTGPSTNSKMVNLTVGGNNGIATLSLKGGTIALLNAIQITSTGILTGSGVIDGDVDNNGKVIADNVTIQNGTLTNHHIMTGNGFINGSVVNADGGVVEAIENDLGFGNGLTNASGGQIAARNTILRFNGSGLTNQGLFGLSFGTSDVFGDIQNDPGGRVVVTGNSNATFWDDMVNNGNVHVRDGATAVFFGSFRTGDGTITGTGDKFFEGDFILGNSPQVSFATGPISFSVANRLEIELGGTTPGDHDKLIVDGLLTFEGGTLDVLLINGFTPEAGDVFDILDWTSLQGGFGKVLLPGLAGKLFWDTSDLLVTGELRVIPEPGTVAMVGALGGLLLLRWRAAV